jgi:Protein of unknown function (DUF2817)
MATSDFFADTYIAAREKFLSAARAARCDLSKYPLRNHTGPHGEELTIDIGKLGPAEPHALLVLISGTHGVEGFCGSGCQVGFLTDRLYEALPANCGALLVHALNPYGFAWLRRVNDSGGGGGVRQKLIGTCASVALNLIAGAHYSRYDAASLNLTRVEQ